MSERAGAGPHLVCKKDQSRVLTRWQFLCWTDTDEESVLDTFHLCSDSAWLFPRLEPASRDGERPAGAGTWLRGDVRAPTTSRRAKWPQW